MPNTTIAARIAGDTEWTGVEVVRPAECDHVDTICSGCWESWATDWTFLAADVPAAIDEALQFASDVALVRSLAVTSPLAEIVSAMHDTGRSEQHIAEVLGEAASGEEEFVPLGEHPLDPVPAATILAGLRGDTAPAEPATERLSLWTLTRMDPVSTVQEGDYHEMYVVAQSAEAARSWAYRRAVLDNKAEPSVWRDGDEFALRVLHFYDVDDDAETGVMLAETWTVEKMAAVPFRRR